MAITCNRKKCIYINSLGACNLEPFGVTLDTEGVCIEYATKIPPEKLREPLAQPPKNLYSKRRHYIKFRKGEKIKKVLWY